MTVDVRREFALPQDRVWLNAAHQGPLPSRAADAVSEMVDWKLRPHHLQPHEAFTDLPERLRARLAQLIGAETSQVVLANSASYGLHLLANGLDLRRGAEVVVASNDFPSDLLPWIHRSRHSGVTVKTVEPAGTVLTADEVASAITDSTRLVCLTWVHSSSGQVVDLDAIGDLCRDSDVLFVVNGSQGMGAIPIDVTEHPIDALISVGFKWLCGPYATGFIWLGTRVLDRLQPTKLYWLNVLTTDDLKRPDVDLTDVSPEAPGCFDIFGTANFFNFAGLLAAADLVLSVGVQRIHAHNLSLAGKLVQELGCDGPFRVGARGDTSRLSSIVTLRPADEPVEAVASRLEEAAIDVAVRAGSIRLSPHLYNTEHDIDRALEALSS